MNLYNFIQMTSYKSNPNFGNSLIDISITLENLKTNQSSLEKEIESRQIYKENLIEKLKNYQNGLISINGISVL